MEQQLFMQPITGTFTGYFQAVLKTRPEKWTELIQDKLDWLGPEAVDDSSCCVRLPS